MKKHQVTGWVIGVLWLGLFSGIALGIPNDFTLHPTVALVVLVILVPFLCGMMAGHGDQV